MGDIFDRLKEKQRQSDVLDRVKDQVDSEKKLDELTKSLSETIKKSIKANKYVPPPPPPPLDLDAEVGKRLPPPLDVDALISDIQKKVLNNLPPPPPQIIVEKHTEKLVEKKEPIVDLDARKDLEELKARKIIDNQARGIISELRKEIEALQGQLKGIKEQVDRPLFIPAPPIIPNWKGSPGKYLTNNGDQLQWGSAVSGGTSITLSDTPTSPAEGDWRLNISGTNLIVERYESGAWAEKGAFES